MAPRALAWSLGASGRLRPAAFFFCVFMMFILVNLKKKKKLFVLFCLFCCFFSPYFVGFSLRHLSGVFFHFFCVGRWLVFLVLFCLAFSLVFRSLLGKLVVCHACF